MSWCAGCRRHAVPSCMLLISVMGMLRRAERLTCWLQVTPNLYGNLVMNSAALNLATCPWPRLR